MNINNPKYLNSTENYLNLTNVVDEAEIFSLIITQ